ncbi:34547_t:CDS:2 [Gigaspora margarita]|uniref:34547_t:CDS:1 n=1 Tax=Gigaspora margarita TaxID=4874 RepID=A0ABM8VX28_GIGMA|nr:34547_t:CDS:2 [Gigaspora margarita]
MNQCQFSNLQLQFTNKCSKNLYVKFKQLEYYLLTKIKFLNSNFSKISAFNIKEFGKTKLSDHNVIEIIFKILERYDIVLCQEVRLSVEMINHFVFSLSKSSSILYSYVSSQPIGRGSYKERYLYLYRSNKWKVLENYVIKRFCAQFLRASYVVRFQNLKNPHIRITLIGYHIHPGNTFEEIKALVNNVYADIKSRLEKKDSFSYLFNLSYCFGSSCISLNDFNEQIIIMSDFNASGSYLNKKKQKILDNILCKQNLIWGIDHSSDTTVGTKCNAYDQFIFEIKNKERWIGNTRIFEFDKIFKILKNKKSSNISDHYPIEFELKLDM